MRKLKKASPKRVDDLQQKIRRAALNSLARRDHSFYELTQKLTRKGYILQDIHPILTELVEEGLLNEARFVENFVSFRRKKGIGPKRLIAEMKTKGVSALHIAEQVHITDNAWLVEIKKLWQKYFKGQLPTTLKMRAKQIRYFQSRGFTHEQIRTLFKDANDDYETNVDE